MSGESARRMAASLRFLERFLLVIAVVALGWYSGVRIFAAREQASWARELQQQSAAAASSAARGTTVRRPAPAPRAIIGRLEVPRLGLSAVAREGVDARTLRSAVGHVPDTALPGEHGNAAFAGHRDTFFRGLGNIRAGDRLVVTTPSGEFQYVVRRTRVVAPTDVSVLAGTPDATLTLITCYPFDYIGSAPQRFIVHADAAF